MANRTKDENLDLFYLNIEQDEKERSQKANKRISKNRRENTKKNNKNNAKLNKKNTNKKNSKNTKKSRQQTTKDDKFNFDDEIIIGLRKIEPDKDKPKNNKKSKKKKKVNKNKIKKLTPEQQKAKERAKRKRKAIFRTTKWLMLFAIIIGGIIYAILSPIFNIKQIKVSGNSKISVDEIISLSGFNLEQNMFTYKMSDVKSKIKENAYIDTVKISRKIPDSIEISVTERQASYAVEYANAYAYISSQGYILEISSQKPNMPILTGIKTQSEDIQPGNRLNNDDLNRLGDVLKIMEAASSNGISDLITKINVTNTYDYVLTLQSKKKTVYLGDTTNLSTKMLWIVTFNEKEGNTAGDIILNMNLNEEKNKPVFRKKL